jgi:hypothetical protein
VYPFFTFVNDTNDLRSVIGKDGWRIEPETETSLIPWSFTYRPTLLGREQPSPLTEPSPDDIGIEADVLVTIRRADVIEWYRNTPDGIKQGFTITKRPGGSGRLNLHGVIDTSLRVGEREGDHITFAHDGTDVLELGSFDVFDAYYTPLPTEVTYDDATGVLVITVDDTDAEYPIVIDPLASTPTWTEESNMVSAQLGFGALARDINSDGFGDIIAGAPGYTNGEAGEGALMVYLGSSSGPSSTPDQIVESNIAGAGIGRMVIDGGDINSDGYTDILVGAPAYDNGQTNEGAVFIYYGSSGGLGTSTYDIIESNIAFEEFGTDDGYALASAGDVNNDGYDDIIVGDLNWYDGVDYVGRAMVYPGSVSGIVSTPLTIFTGTSLALNFGSAAASVGDVNSDGYDDIIVSGEQGNVIQLYHGGASGPDTTPEWTSADNDLGWTLDAGDVNGDGYIDIIAGSAGDDQIGAYYGSATGFPNAPDWVHYDNGISDSNQGWLTVGDANNDGYDDVLVGSGSTLDITAYTGGWGGVFLYHGSPYGLVGVADWFTGGDPYVEFGYSVSLGDVNNDGFDDAVVGAPLYVNGESDEGRVYLYYGNSDSLYGSGDTDVYNPKPRQIIVGPPPGSFSFTESLASGDFKGDGNPDVVAGAGNTLTGMGLAKGVAYAYYGNGDGTFSTTSDAVMTTGDADSRYFAGSGRLAAGDVNGDGYDDVIASDASYTDVAFNDGGVFLFYGSVSGLSTTPDWSFTGSSTMRLGEAVTVVDADDDGYADIYVASSGFTSEYVIYGFHGSASGPSSVPDWIYGNGTMSNIEMLSSPGDVNGDGYADMLAADPYYTNGQSSEGRILLFNGSVSGLSLTPDWSFETDVADASLGSKYAGQGWGGPMGDGGDFNNDGYSDFAVGAMAYEYTVSSFLDGATYVFYGSPTGPGVTEDVFLTQEVNGPNQLFGNGVTSPGDVNGDGYDDLLVGAPEVDEGAEPIAYGGGQLYEGRLYMYYGSATGVSTTPSWTSETNRSETWMGQTVVRLGDANGDGYADFAGGSVWQIPSITGGDQGAIYVYLSQGYFGVTESGGSTLLDECALTTDTFAVVLDTEPTSNVVFDIVSQDAGAATVSVSTLTFTNGNWDTPQTVTVSPVADGDINDERVPIVISVNRAASNDAFDNTPAQHVLALVTDGPCGGGTVPPTVTATAPTTTSSTTATLIGNITATGGENASVRGFNYGPTASYGSTTSEVGSFGTGAFTLSVSGLICGTTYHFEAYATNSAGVGDSSDTTFSTAACPSTPSSTPSSTPTTSSSGGGGSSGTRMVSPTTTPFAPTTTVLISDVFMTYDPLSETLTVIWKTNVPVSTDLTYRVVTENEPPTRINSGGGSSTVHSATFSVAPNSLLSIVLGAYTSVVGDTGTTKTYHYFTSPPPQKRAPEPLAVAPSIPETIPPAAESLPPTRDTIENPAPRKEATTTSQSGTPTRTTVPEPTTRTRDVPDSLLYLLTALGLIALGVRPALTSPRLQTFTDMALAVRRIFSIVLPRRRRIVEAWGTVYDARTKRPLDPAYVALMNVATGEEVVSAVTDLEGRYGFLMNEPGRYCIVPQKTHYEFPSREIYRNHNDYVYDNLYFGEDFEIFGPGTIIRRNIPMDATGRDWNEEEKVRMGIVSSRKKRQLLIHFMNLLFLAGFGYTLYALITSPGLWNGLMTFLYVVIIVVEYLWKRHFHLTTVVRRANGTSVPFALIKVFHEHQSIVVKQVVADMFGKFYLLIAPGVYRVTVEVPKPDGTYALIHTMERAELPKGIFLKDIIIP